MYIKYLLIYFPPCNYFGSNLTLINSLQEHYKKISFKFKQNGMYESHTKSGVPMDVRCKESLTTRPLTMTRENSVGYYL